MIEDYIKTAEEEAEKFMDYLSEVEDNMTKEEWNIAKSCFMQGYIYCFEKLSGNTHHESTNQNEDD